MAWYLTTSFLYSDKSFCVFLYARKQKSVKGAVLPTCSFLCCQFQLPARTMECAACDMSLNSLYVECKTRLCASIQKFRGWADNIMWLYHFVNAINLYIYVYIYMQISCIRRSSLYYKSQFRVVVGVETKPSLFSTRWMWMSIFILQPLYPWIKWSEVSYGEVSLDKGTMYVH